MDTADATQTLDLTDDDETDDDMEYQERRQPVNTANCPGHISYLVIVDGNVTITTKT